jgi:uncharacterized protein YndB with AHSA1/START domain
MFGTLEQIDDGRWRVRFTRRLAHPIDKVWRAITEPDHLAHWFPCSIDGERKAGAPLTFRFQGDVDPIEGEMVVFDPPSCMELRWGGDLLRLELQATEDHGTELVLTDTLDALGKAARDAAGWHECLELLGHEVAGEPAPFELGDVWKDVHPRYQERFGPEASTIGPRRATIPSRGERPGAV